MVPEKPLKILTLDGGGLQAISTLLTLDKLLSTVAENSKVPYKKPRPCDVFDTIAGIGAGGWLAILLGRFHSNHTFSLSRFLKLAVLSFPSCVSSSRFLILEENIVLIPCSGYHHMLI